MYPTSQYMDPYYSHFRNHAPYPYYPPPGWEAGHPRAMDSSYRPPSYGPLPYNPAMHHSHPPEFHCCCNPSYPPGYYGFRPPFPQELPPPHLYYHGPFPQYLNEHPSYFVPPHPYPVDQTPYDFNKLKNHCCGCPNHVCHGGEKSNVKIEEESPDAKPERELKDADNSSMIRHPNRQYPVIWLPSGNIEDKENRKRYELPPQILNGWVPVGGKRADDAKQQGKNDQKEKQFQWPIVWMPAGYDEPKQKAKELKEKDENQHIIEENPPSPKVKIIPLSWFQDQKPAAKNGSGDHNDRSAVESQPATTENRDGTAVDGHHKTTPAVPRIANDERKPTRENYKTIPVLPKIQTDEKKPATYRTIPVMSQKEDEKQPVMSENKGEKKANSAEKQGENGKGSHTDSATSKHSKLPPVCLRVDPLPRKKSGNGSSRSPSPPTRKDANKDKNDTNKTQNQNLEPKTSDTKKNITVSDVKDKSPEELKKDMGCNNETMTAVSKHSQEELSTGDDQQKVQASSTSAQETASANTEGGGIQENAGEETLKEGDKSTNKDSETFRAKLSEADAAVRIQSAYRGYDVRRWQPLDKLRKIRDVHEQMQGVKKHLKSLEASANKPTEKEQVAIGEAIMNLLLKLDTIQGLHPCVREARKSVARELISLQEKLDSLCKQSSGGFNHTNEDEKLDIPESVTSNADPTLTAEPSDKGEIAVGLNEAKEISPVNSMELCDATPSEVNMEVGQDAVPSELKNWKEESCISTMEVPHEEEKAAEQVGFQGGTPTEKVLPEHTHDNHERQIEESHAISLEVNTGDKKVAVADEGKEMSPIDCMGPLHDATLTVNASGQDKCMASTVQSFHAEGSNAVVSPVITGDIKDTTATESLDYELAACSDESGEDRTSKAVGAEPELNHDVSPGKETSNAILEDPHTLKDAEPHKHDPTTAAESNVDEQSAGPGSINMQEQVTESTQDSTNKPDGASEASMGYMEPAASEEPAQASLDRPTSKFDLGPEQSVLEESNCAMQSELSGKDDSPHVDQKDEVPELTGETDMQGSNHSLAEGAGPRAETETVSQELDSSESPCVHVLGSVPEQTVADESSYAMQSELHGNEDSPHVDRKNEVLELTLGETDIKGSDYTLAEGADPRAETAIPESDSSESPWAHEEAITEYERPEMKVSLNSQTAEQSEGVPCAETQVPKIEQRSDTPKQSPSGVIGANSVEEVDTRVCQTEECTGVASGEMEMDNLKEDVHMQTESKGSEEAAPATPSGVNDSDEKKLAEENQKLRELLQKILASGNDQMEVITDLSEKVKVLERKLARKKKPKVRVHRPARNATAKAH